MALSNAAKGLAKGRDVKFNSSPKQESTFSAAVVALGWQRAPALLCPLGPAAAGARLLVPYFASQMKTRFEKNDEDMKYSYITGGKPLPRWSTHPVCLCLIFQSCQADLVKDNGHKYFLSVLADPYMPVRTSQLHSASPSTCLACLGLRGAALMQLVLLQGCLPQHRVLCGRVITKLVAGEDTDEVSRV